MRVKKLLDSIGRDVDTVSPDETVYDALALMAKKEIGALVVLENEKLVGIISERDYARKVILKGKSSKDPSATYGHPRNTSSQPSHGRRSQRPRGAQRRRGLSVFAHRRHHAHRTLRLRLVPRNRRTG